MRTIFNCIFGAVTIYILLMSLSTFLKVSPPASVITTAFRIPYQMIAQYLIIFLMLGLIVYYGFLLIEGISPTPFSIACSVVLFICIVIGIVFCTRILTVNVLTSGEGYEYTAQINRAFNVEVDDMHERAGMEQLMVYTPLGSDRSNICIIHLNYGGWAVQDIKMRGWFKKFCTQQGYSFVQLAGIGNENGNFFDIVKDIKSGILFLQNEKKYDSIILTGGSSGGTFSLVIALSGTYPEIYGEEQIKIDGVIALYPMIDAALNYDYFVLQGEKNKGLFNHLGDAMYCMLFNGKTGTLSGESKLLMERTFGTWGDPDDSKYKFSNVNNLIKDQDIPILILQGSMDSMLPIEDKRELFENWKLQNKTISYLELPGLDHAFDLMDDSVQTIRIKKEISSWLYKFTHCAT